MQTNHHKQTDAEHEFNLLQMLLAEVKQNKAREHKGEAYVNHHDLHSYPSHA